MTTIARSPTIIVGYDGSAASQAALTVAARRAGKHGLVVIVHSFGLPSDFLGSPSFDELVTDRQSRGRALLDAYPSHRTHIGRRHMKCKPH